jgi:mannose-6-phosphate isomerase-like protein (cupin superfamily)
MTQAPIMPNVPAPIRILRRSDAETFELPGVTFAALAAPSRGSDQLCLWTITVAPGLDSPEAHTLNHDEVFLVLGGTLRLSPDGEVLGAGDCAVVPAGAPIQAANPGGEVATACVAIRAGFRAFAADGSAIGVPPWAA